MTPLDAERVRGRLAVVRGEIAAHGVEPSDVAIVAVTKGFGLDVVRAAAACGLADVGENYSAELLAKAADAKATDLGPVRWNFIGRLQRNKVRKLAGVVELWQSIDRAEVGAELARRAPGARVLVQVNVTGEEAKGGCEPERTAPLVEELCRLGLAVEGLMTVAPATSPSVAGRAFEALRRQADGLGLRHCSMGMSGDYLPAVLAGSTMLRLGTVLFGPRPHADDVQN